MIALTQEKREELIAHNTEKLKGLKQSVEQTAFESVKEELELEIQSTEVTLASLTAENIGWGLRRTDVDKVYGSWLTSSPRQQSYLDYQPHAYENVPLYAAPPVPEIKLSLLQPRDLEALIGFNETCEDGEGYDLSKDKMDRLVELGVVRKIKGGIREITALGQMYIDINCQDSPSEFLMTETDRAAAFNQHIKRLNGLGE